MISVNIFFDWITHLLPSAQYLSKPSSCLDMITLSGNISSVPFCMTSHCCWIGLVLCYIMIPFLFIQVWLENQKSVLTFLSIQVRLENQKSVSKFLSISKYIFALALDFYHWICAVHYNLTHCSQKQASVTLTGFHKRNLNFEESK